MYLKIYILRWFVKLLLRDLSADNKVCGERKCAVQRQQSLRHHENLLGDAQILSSGWPRMRAAETGDWSPASDADCFVTNERRGNFEFATIHLRQGLVQSIRVQ
jgi:hypothetical protein